MYDNTYYVFEGTHRTPIVITTLTASDAAKEYIRRMHQPRNKIILTVFNAMSKNRYLYTYTPPKDPEGTLVLDN